jgi:hypothetical protein
MARALPDTSLRGEIDMGDTSTSTVARFPVQFNPLACNTVVDSDPAK